jgi:4-amino-4-deoxy-L-arabinose transferase-like glycosyltransferase
LRASPPWRELLWLVIPFAFLSFDTWYAVVWGNELAHGMSPDYGSSQPPTPHPLGVIWSALVSPLGAIGASDATIVLAYLALGAVAYLVYRLGALWFDHAIGVVAAVIVLTRTPFLLYGLRASPDLPYIAIVLAALLTSRGRQARRAAAGGDRGATARGVDRACGRGAAALGFLRPDHVR